MKKFLTGLCILTLVIIFGPTLLNPEFKIAPAILIGALFAAILFASKDENKVRKESGESEEVLASRTNSVDNNVITPKFMTTPRIQPPLNQFEQDVRNRVQNAIKGQVNGTIIWDVQANNGIALREDFWVPVRVNGKNILMKVEMSQDGPTRVSFAGDAFQSISIRKKKKTPAKPAEAKPTLIAKPKAPVAKPAPVTKPTPVAKPSNAEKKGNTVINKDGKPEVKPNYRMMASDWINNNLEYMNKACNDAMIAGRDIVEALLAQDKLPDDREAWDAIGALLLEQEEIDSYRIVNNGIIVTIE